MANTTVESAKVEAAAAAPQHLKVSSYAAQFCRAGYFFTPTPLLINVEDLSDEQLASIMSEPHLKVELI